ncbi:hypothetical protein [Aromatoleum buckelii]|uniref:Uncharacterized protein n=1 Tax=Aromatoleum buckelii TaxID=200254 RepID=A0ABX1N7D3_9RHOO|nr:hypothetical protein [Aromatoleum buckelii]MCK0510925.1 hypothetical protein [Aromatoleum buckelii]
METRLSLRYTGPAVDAGAMDVYEASANMIAFSEFMVAAVKTSYGNSTEARAEVAGFAQGSFVTDLVFTVGGPAASLFSALTPDHLITVVKEAFGLWKHLKGSPPAAVTQAGQHVFVTNNSGQVIQVQTDTLNLVFNEKATDAVGRFVREAVNQQGVDAVEIAAAKDPIAWVTQAEAASFVPVVKEALVSENVVRMTLILVAPVFQDGNKWRFSDGATTFSAAILDEAFLERVNGGERFGKGDALEVEMLIVQTRSASKISLDRSVLKVIEHREAAQQTRLL